MDLFKNGTFVQQKFKDSIKNSFISTGCAPDIDNSYQKYNATANKGSIPIIPSGTVEQTEFPVADEHYIDLVNLIDNDDEETDDEDQNLS
jgi:hypothetical protein